MQRGNEESRLAEVGTPWAFACDTVHTMKSTTAANVICVALGFMVSGRVIIPGHAPGLN
jgi:hypothetical protein